MKKPHMTVAALAVILAAFAVAETSAWAAPVFLLALWLFNGSEVTAALAVNVTGELLLEDTKGFFGLKTSILCSGITHATLEADSLGKATEMLSLSGIAVNMKTLEEHALECTNEENCPEPLVWAVHLPYKAEVELMEDGGAVFFIDLLSSSGAGNPGVEVNCMGNGVTDECTAGELVEELTLEGATLLGRVSEAFSELAGIKLATCSLGGAESGVIEGEGVVADTEGGELSASSEGVEA